MAKIKIQVQKSFMDEYRCAYYEDGVYREGPTYYTEDRADAFSTARYMGKEAEKQGHTVTVGKGVRGGMDF